MPLTAQHWIKEKHGSRVITHCGKEGYVERDFDTEFSTVLGARFEAYSGLSQVTCKSCIKSAERISKSPWGL